MTSENGKVSYYQCRNRTTSFTDGYKYHLSCQASNGDQCPISSTLGVDLKVSMTVTKVKKRSQNNPYFFMLFIKLLQLFEIFQVHGNLRQVILQYESNGTYVNAECGNSTCLWTLDADSKQKTLGPLKKDRIYTPLTETITKMTNTKDNHTIEEATLVIR